MAQLDELVGRELGGYRLTRMIGKGGGGAVFLGERDGAPDPRAIKTLLLPPDTSAEARAEFQARFVREAQAARLLEHEYIVPLLGYGEDDGVMYLVMPYYPAGTLSQRLESGSIPLEDASRYVTQLAAALDYAHARNIVHRDIKPSNVLLGPDGRVLLSDFGIAHLNEPNGITTTGEVLGTYGYMPPEQMQGSGDIDQRADVYALGVLAYQLVTGRLPFSASTLPALVAKVIGEQPAAPNTLRADLPAPVAGVMLRALAKDPVMRFASAGEMAQSFEAGVHGEAPLDNITQSFVRRATEQVGGLSGAGAQPGAPLGPQPGEQVGSQPGAQRGPLPANGVAGAQGTTARDQAAAGLAASSRTLRSTYQAARRYPLWAAIAGGLVVVLLVVMTAHAMSGGNTPPTENNLTSNSGVSAATDTPPPTWTPADTATPDVAATANADATAQASAGTPTVYTGPTPVAGTVLYTADWSNGMDGWSGSSQWKVNSNMLLSDGTTADYILAPYQVTTPNYSVVANIKVIRSLNTYNGCNFWLVSRMDSAGNGYSGGIEQFLGASGSNSYLFLSLYNHNNLVQINYSPSPSDATHTYEMDSVNNQLTFSIDGKQLLQTIDNTYLSPGSAGIYSDSCELEITGFQIIAK